MNRLFTPWGETLDREHPLREYPRPQLKRDSYVNLNGLWSYAFTDDEHRPERFDGKIVVPFSPETILSGVERQLQPDEYLWYERAVTLPEGFVRDRVMAGLSEQQRAEVAAALEEGKNVGVIGGPDGPTEVYVTDRKETDDE